MSTVTQPTENGGSDAKSTPNAQAINLSPAATEFIMTVALQKQEWLELQSVSGLTVRLDNYRDPHSGRFMLMVVFASDQDDFSGDDATGKIFVNNVDIDELLIKVIENVKEKATKATGNATPTENAPIVPLGDVGNIKKDV